MKKILWVMVMMVGCFSALKKGKITSEKDEFTGKEMVHWTGLVKSEINQAANSAAMLLGATGASNLVSVVIDAEVGSSSASATLIFSAINGDDTAKFQNTATINWSYKTCHDVAFLIGSDPAPLEGATWDGQAPGGDPQETIKVQVPAEIINGGPSKVRVCKTVIIFTEEQKSSLGKFAQLAQMKPSPKKTLPASVPSSQSTSVPVQ